MSALMAGLPVGVVTYLLVWWSLRQGYLGEASTFKDVENEVKVRKKDKEKSKASDPVHRKWLSLGGGFYGVVALITLAWIEIGEVMDFFSSFEGIGSFLGSISVGFFVNLIIETIRNTITALVWPVYWLSSIHTPYPWIWFIVAYAGYWAGSSLAIDRFRNGRSA